MEKKIIQEINQIRSMMGLSLIKEAGIADVLDDVAKKMLEVVGKDAEEMISIGVGKTAKKIRWGELVAHMRNYRNLTVENKKLVQDFLKSEIGKSWFANYKAGVSKVTNKTQKGMHTALIKKMESDMPGLVGGSVSGTQSAVSSKASNVGVGSIENQLKQKGIKPEDIWLPNYKEVESRLKLEFPKAPRSKYAEIVNLIKTGGPKSANDLESLVNKYIETYAPQYKDYLIKEANKVSIWNRFVALGWKSKTIIVLTLLGGLSQVGLPVADGLRYLLNLVIGGGKEIYKGAKDTAQQQMTGQAPDGDTGTGTGGDTGTGTGGDTGTGTGGNTGSSDNKKEKKSSDDDNKSSGDTDLSIDDF